MCAEVVEHYRPRWLLLLAAFVVMAIIGIYQYSWFLFSFKLQRDLGWSLASLGLVYTVFHYTSTLIMPVAGHFADSYGPRNVAVLAAVLVGAGFVLCASFLSVWPVGLSYGVGGVGCGILYGVSTATAIKWFPDRRGFATGLAVFGFGAGTALFNPLIERSLQARGLATTFLYLGVLMLSVLVPLAMTYRYPRIPAVVYVDHPGQPENETGADFQPKEMLRTYQWYLIYFSFSFTISIVLIFGAQMKLLSTEYHLPPSYFSALLVLFPLANGLSRVAAGAVSDRIGRGRTMQLFYSLLGLSTLALVWFGSIPILFFTLVILAALMGGAPFALYPAIIGDFYGSRFATTNYGITYTAKSWAGVISGWLSGYLVTRFGSFTLPLVCVGIFSLLAALASAPRFLKPPLKETSRSLSRDPSCARS